MADKPGNETILLVDDEEDVLEMMHLMLERFGYRVFPKISSIEALEEFRREPEKFDLIITDQTMPKMTGMELIENLMRIRSDIPIIVSASGAWRETSVYPPLPSFQRVFRPSFLNRE